MQITVVPPYDVATKLSLARLKTAGTIVYPTDTIYGVGCDALSKEAVERVRDIKKREQEKPLSVMFANWESAKNYLKIDEMLVKKLQKLTPGPYTFLLPLEKKMMITDDMYLGCRIPDNEFCKLICEQFQNPIVTTSANITGQKSPSSAFEIDEEVLQKVDLIVDGGTTKYMDGSTIIDVEGKKILRNGAGLQKAKDWLQSL